MRTKGRSRFALRMGTTLATAIFLVACGERSSESTKAAPQRDVEASVATKPLELTTLINRSPMFESPEGWGPGFTKAIGHGLGVVVGPGRDNPNGLAQEFRARAGEPFKIVARASSVDAPSAKGRLQVNWTDASGKLISSYIKTIDLTSEEKTFEASLEAPAGAVSGTIYVVADGQSDVVRYREMRLLGKGGAP